MTNHDMAASHLSQAAEISNELEILSQRRVWNLVVRRSQEVVELALKGVLRAAGLEVPRLHDVGILLKDHRKKLSGTLAEDVDRIASISRRLRREREASFYGDDEVGAPPDQLYTEADAVSAMEDACYVLNICRQWYETVKKRADNGASS